MRDYFNVPLPPQLNFNYSPLLGGIEILMDMSSAQLAVFSTRGRGVEFGYVDWEHPKNSPWGSLSITTYQGAVWNLWNTEDYSGWFDTVGFESNGPFRTYGGALFWDTADGLRGPWGIAKGMLSFSLFDERHESYTVLSGKTDYHLWYGPYNFPSEQYILPYIVLSSLFHNALNAAVNGSNPWN